MRALGPLPWTCCRSTPSAGAGTVAGAPAAGLEGVCAGAEMAEGALVAGAALAAAAGAPPALAERTRIGEPFDTLSPTLIFSSRTTPWEGDGISIVALSDSSVMSDCSFATA